MSKAEVACLIVASIVYLSHFVNAGRVAPLQSPGAGPGPEEKNCQQQS